MPTITFPDVPGVKVTVDEGFTEQDIDEIYDEVRPSTGAFRKAIGDTAVALAKGVVAFPQGLAGLVDIGAGLAGTGSFSEAIKPLVDFETTQTELGKLYSPDAKRAQRRVDQAKGVWDTLTTVLKNPSIIQQQMGESLPSMLGGAAAAKKLIGAGVGRAAAAGIGEGTITAGQQASDIREATPGGDLSPGQAGAALVSGVFTGALGSLGSKMASKLGIADIDTLTNPKTSETVKRSIIAKVIGGAITEGALEELPQSVQEQMTKNLATGKPWNEGLEKAGVLGGIVGGIMGGAAAPFTGGQTPPAQPTTPTTPETPVTETDVLEGGIENALEAANSLIPDKPMFNEGRPIDQSGTLPPEVPVAEPQQPVPLPEQPVAPPQVPNLLPRTTKVMQDQFPVELIEPLPPLEQIPYNTSGLTPEEKLRHEAFVESFFGENEAIEVGEVKPDLQLSSAPPVKQPLQSDLESAVRDAGDIDLEGTSPTALTPEEEAFVAETLKSPTPPAATGATGQTLIAAIDKANKSKHASEQHHFDPSTGEVTIGHLDRADNLLLALARAAKSGELKRVNMGLVEGPKAILLFNDIRKALSRSSVEMVGEVRSGDVIALAEKQQKYAHNPSDPKTWSAAEREKFKVAVKELGLDASSNELVSLNFKPTPAATGATAQKMPQSLEALRIREQAILSDIDDWRSGKFASPGQPMTGENYARVMRDQVSQLDKELSDIRSKISTLKPTTPAQATAKIEQEVKATEQTEIELSQLQKQYAQRRKSTESFRSILLRESGRESEYNAAITAREKKSIIESSLRSTRTSPDTRNSYRTALRRFLEVERAIEKRLATPEPLTNLIDQSIAALEAKIKPPGDTTQAVLIPGLDPATARAVYNSALRIAIGVLKATKNIQQAIQAAINYIKKALAERGRTLDSDTEAALRKDLEAGAQVEPEGTPKQMGGRPRITAPREVESIAATETLTREKYFDPSVSSPANNERWWDVANRMTNPATKTQMAADIQAETQTDIGQSLLLRDLRHYAVKTAALGDFSMFEHMLDHYNSMGSGVATDSGIAEASGRGLRGLQLDDAEKALWNALKTGFNGRTEAVKKTLKLTGPKEEADIFQRLKDLLDQVNMTPEEFLDALDKQKTKTGKKASDIIKGHLPSKPATEEEVEPDEDVEPEESWQDKTAQSILDKMESSQTEWVKPKADLNAVKEYVKQAIAETTFPQLDKPDGVRNVEAYIDKTSGELQAIGVRTELSARLAWEIYKERLNRWSLKRRKLRQKTSTDEANAALKRLMDIQKRPSDPTAFRKVYQEAMAAESSPENFSRLEFIEPLTQRFKEVGVDADTAKTLAEEIYQKKREKMAGAQSAIVQRAGANTKALVREFLIEIKQPSARYTTERDRASTIKRAAEKYFRDAGVEPSRVSSAMSAYQSDIQNAFDAAVNIQAEEAVAARTKAEGKTGPTPDTVIQRFLTGLLNIKSPAKQDAIQKILNDAKSRKLSVQDYAQPDQWKGDLQDRLVAAGATADISARVADELYTAKIPEFASAQAGKFQRAAEDVPGIVRAILTAIKANPYRAQDAAWRQSTIQSYFEKAGLTPERAASVTKAMDLIFVVRESDARTKGAEQLLKERPERVPKEKLDAELDKLRKAIRIGLTDPDQRWTDVIAKVNKWKGFTKAEHQRLGELMEQLDNPDTLTHERAKLLTEMNRLMATKTPPHLWGELASFYSNNQLAGTGTALLSAVTPGFSSGIRLAMDAASGMLTGDFGKPLAAAQAMMQAVKSMNQEFKFSMQYDAYTKRALQTIETMQNLYALMQRSKADLDNKTLPPLRRAWGLIRYIGSHVDMVRTFLSATDQAWQSAISDYVKLMGSRELLKKAGNSDADVRTMLSDVFLAGEQFYQEALGRGLSDVDAKLEAKDRVWLGMRNMLDTEANSRDVEKVFETGDLEAELEVGNYRGEGGWAQTAIRSAMDAVQKKNPLIYRLVFGFPRVNLNLLSRAAWYSPWGFKRLAFDYYQRRTGAPKQYHQSMRTELQRRQRMAETIAGTVGFIALAALYARERDKEDEEKMVWFDFAGPRDAVMKQAWLRSGHRPYTVGIKVGDKRVAINWNRGGMEAIQTPFAVLGAYEDAKLNGREDAFLTAMADGIGLIGIAGTGRRDYTSEASLTYTAASKASGFIPMAGLIRTITKLSDAPDTKSIKGALIAATPGAPAFSDKPALNVLGDPVGDITTLRIQKLGVPITIVTPERLYQLLSNAKEGPPRPSRNAAEQKNGLFGHPVTDDQWYDFYKATGKNLKAAMNEDYTKLKEMEPEELDKWLTKASNQARKQAKKDLDL